MIRTITLEDNITQIICPNYETFKKLYDDCVTLLHRANYTVFSNSILVNTTKLPLINHLIK